jgi:hypothetical protein
LADSTDGYSSFRFPLIVQVAEFAGNFETAVILRWRLVIETERKTRMRRSRPLLVLVFSGEKTRDVEALKQNP